MRFLTIFLLAFIGGIYVFNLRAVNGSVVREYRSPAFQVAQGLYERDQRRELERQFEFRVAQCRKLLESYRSPMAEDCRHFLMVARSLNLPDFILPVISIVESTGGRFIPPGSFNAWGWNRGRAVFASFADGASVVGRGLAYTYDTSSVRKIAYRYCPPSDCNTEAWVRNVETLMQKANEL